MEPEAQKQGTEQAHPWGEIWEGGCKADQRQIHKRLGCVKNNFSKLLCPGTTVCWKKQVHFVGVSPPTLLSNQNSHLD